jgi:DUF1680 family protein
MANIGPEEGKLHGYPGHPELELAVLRLYALTEDPKHLDFGNYLLSERGVAREEYGNVPYFVHEAKVREDDIYPSTIDSLESVECVTMTRSPPS